MARGLVLGILGISSWFHWGSIHLHFMLFWIESLVFLVTRPFKLSAKLSQGISLLLSLAALSWIWSNLEFNHSWLRVIFLFLIRKIFYVRGVKVSFWFPILCTFILDFAVTGTEVFQEYSLFYYTLILSLTGGLRFSSWQDRAFGVVVLIQSFSIMSHHTMNLVSSFLSIIFIPWIAGVVLPFHVFEKETLDFILWIHDQGPSLWWVSGSFLVWGSIFALFFLWTRSNRVLGAVVLLLVIIRMTPHPLEKKVIQWNIGQGDSALIQTNAGHFLIDAGSSRKHHEGEWLDRLIDADVDQIHGVFISHLDEDHVGGLRLILPTTEVSCIQAPELMWKSDRGQAWMKWIHENFQKTKITSQSCNSEIKNAYFQSKGAHAKGNELMQGFAFELSEKSMYFAAGDSDEFQELEYYEKFKSEIIAHPIRYWKTSHHGSRFSSNFDFIEKLAPRECVISVGAHNSYHHPHPLALMRLHHGCEKIDRTDQDGDVTFSANE